jgi:hypothetical protein
VGEGCNSKGLVCGIALTKGREALDSYQDKWNAYSLDGLPALKASRKRLGKSVAADKVKAWVRGVWKGKLDAVLLGWLIGVFIAIINEVVQRYGETIKATIVEGIHQTVNRRG